MSESHTELTATQQQTATELLSILAQNAGQRIIILLLGISGVGKTLLLNLLGTHITEAGGAIVTTCDLMYHDSQSPRETITKARGPLVCTCTPHEHRELQERLSPLLKKRRITDLVLKGMSDTEIETYISKALPEGMKLSLKQLARYSLGIPLLADDLLALNLTEEHAFRLSAKYFFQNTGWTADLADAKDLLAKYLNVPAPPEFFEDFPNKVLGISFYESRRIYDSLYSFRAIQRDELRFTHKGDEDVPDPNPLFVAPESEGIYDAMLASQTRNSSMHLYVPSMTPKQAATIIQILGFHFEFGHLHDTRQTKLKLFGASYRKVSFCFQNEEGAKGVADNECNFVESLGELYRSQVAKGKYPPLTIGKSTCSMVVEAHDHHGLPGNPIRIGWGLETILQHAGVSYLVNSLIAYKLYAYDAKSKHIVELGECEDIPVWSLKTSSRQW